MSFGSSHWEALCEYQPSSKLRMPMFSSGFDRKWRKWRGNMRRQMVSKFRLPFELSPDSDKSSRRLIVRCGQRWAFASALAGLLRSYNSDSSHLALLNQFNKANVRFVKSVVSHWGAGLSGFLTKPLIHRQPLLENRTPFAGQVGGGMYFE